MLCGGAPLSATWPKQRWRVTHILDGCTPAVGGIGWWGVFPSLLDAESSSTRSEDDSRTICIASTDFPTDLPPGPAFAPPPRDSAKLDASIAALSLASEVTAS